MTFSSLQRLLRHHFGPSARILKRDGFELTVEKNGARLTVGKGATVDEAAKSLLVAMAEVRAEWAAEKMRA